MGGVVRVAFANQSSTGVADPRGMKRFWKVRGSWFPTHSAKRRGKDGARCFVSFSRVGGWLGSTQRFHLSAGRRSRWTTNLLYLLENSPPIRRLDLNEP